MDEEKILSEMKKLEADQKPIYAKMVGLDLDKIPEDEESEIHSEIEEEDDGDLSEDEKLIKKPHGW